MTQLIVREESHTLYGFMSAEERDLFRLLINNVTGIGPKTALNVLSGINVSSFRGAVATGDVKVLSQISGVGKKTAERMVVELRDKIDPAEALASRAVVKSTVPGAVRTITCTEWGCNQVGYQTWWYRHLPSVVGKATDGKLNDWWQYVIDPNAVFLTD